MNDLRISNRKIYVNGVEVKQIEDLHIHAKANNPAEVEMKWLVPIEGLDVSTGFTKPPKCLICGEEGTLQLENGQWICENCAMAMGEKAEG